MGRFNIICLDDSQYSRSAFDWYIENYHNDGDTLALLHIYVAPSMPMGGSMMDPSPFITVYETMVEKSIFEAKALKSKYEKLCGEKKISHVTLVVDSSNSSPGHMICKTVKEKKADAIIMGKRGLGMISRKLLGSVSDYVIHHAHIPVTVVPTRKSE